MTLFFLTATIFSLNFDKTSTSDPTSEIDGALMKTPLNEGIPIEFKEISDSKDSLWRPKEFRSSLISNMSNRG